MVFGVLGDVLRLANTELRSLGDYKDLNIADRGEAMVRLSDVARVELGAEEAEVNGGFTELKAVYLAVWPLVGSNEIDVAHRLKAVM